MKENITITLYDQSDNNQKFKISKSSDSKMLQLGQIFDNNDYTMEMSQDIVKRILPHLTEFAETGKISYNMTMCQSKQ